jgi:uncharacterized membrane protein
MMRRIFTLLCLNLLLVTVAGGIPVLAQEEPTPAPAPTELTVFTDYPSQVAGIGETVTLPLQLQAPTAQIVRLAVQDVPEGWTASFRGANRIVESVYVQPTETATVDLRVEPPADVAASAYTMTVVAQGDGAQATLPLALTIQEKLPPRLAFGVELPTIRGRPDTTFRYDVTLENEGDEDLTVTLGADAGAVFEVTYQLNGQEVTDIPLAAGESKRLSVQAQPLTDVEAGVYPITLNAQSETATATTELAAEVTGQANLVVTAPEGRLSGEAYTGQTTPFQVIIQNSGTAPVRGIELSASPPAGWSITFEPAQIGEIAPGGQAEVTANVQPAAQAVAGDYMVTVTARPQEGTSKSVDFRITVLTSTLWGIVGVGLIAVAVGVVGLAVSRFGRR